MTKPTSHGRPRARRVRRRVELERRDRAPAGEGRGGDGAGEPAARNRGRLGLHRLRSSKQIDGARPRRRPLVRRRGDHERRDRSEERRRPRLRRGLRARARARPWAQPRPDSKDSVLNSALVPLHYPTANGGEPATEFAIDPAQGPATRSRPTSPAEQAALIAATQRPVAESAFSEPSGPPAWKQPAVMGGRRHRRQGGRRRSSSARWRSGPARRSPRSRART